MKFRSATLGLAALLSLTPVPASAEISAGWVYGTVTHLTSTAEGVMIRINDGEVPTNCVAPPYGWMLISHAHPEMVSVMLSLWLSNKRTFYIYTGATSSGSFCAVSQVYPQ